MKGLAHMCGTDREEALEQLWTKAWDALAKTDPVPIVDSENPITDALNHPAGKLAEAAMIRLQKYGPRVGDGLRAPARPYFDAVAAAPHGHLGRVMLTTRLPYLFALDQKWAERWLVPLLKPADSAEAANLWYAYGWSRTISPDLLLAIKARFLEVLRDGEVAARTKHNLTLIFIAVCLDAPNELTHDEVSSVVSAMSERELKAVLECLTQRLIGEPSEQAELWREKIGPWLQRYWPIAESRNTAATSNAMLKMLVVCGDAFPEAVAWSLNYLQPTQGDLIGLTSARLLKRHPLTTLEILDKVVGEEGVRPHNRGTLRGILHTIQTAVPERAATAKFQRLYRFATE